MEEKLMPPETPQNSITPSYAPEFALLLACIRWPFTSVERENLRALATPDLDWPRFLRMAQSHEVMPLAYRNLRAANSPNVPATVMNELRTRAAFNMVSNAQWQKSLVSLLDRLEKAGLRTPRLLKGIPLAIEAFGDAALRITNDIDLLVSPEEVAQVDALLIASGYQRTAPAAKLTPRRFAACLASWKDFSYVHPRDSITVEVHWRLHLNPAMPTFDLADAGATAWTTLGDRQVAILPPDELFLYLCTHGALDGWYKLKWLADVAAIARQLPQERLEALCVRARRLGMLTEFSAALLLANRLLDSRLECAGLLADSEPTVARILDHSLRLITARDYCPEWEAGPETIRYELALRPALNYRLQTLRRILFRPRMWEQFDLPDWLFGLYALISPFEWYAYHRRESRMERG